ncbi:MAG: hypothetical protein ACLPWF_28825 [Bryobacteraceae bacterium]
MRATALVLGLAVATALCGQTPPDFSGVYYPVNPFGNFRGGPAAGARQQQGPPPRPTASAPVGDGSNGRRPDEPSLTPEYMAKWQMISKSLISGSSKYDAIANCLPPGMPAVMSMFYGMEVMQNKDKITFFSELNDAMRRVYLDGRKPSQKVLDDPTYAGYSTGHWEGDTLVVDTVAIRGDTFIEGITPHSDEMTVHERIRLLEPTLLEDHITVTDPKALTKPWETTKTYRKAKSGSGQDELREFACAEGYSEVK